MADWVTISSLATAAGTLVLATATFASVRSANRAARVAEQAFQAGMRPLLMPSRLEDPSEKMTWGDGHWTKVDGGRGAVELGDDVIYLAMSLRNAGSGIGVIQGWHVQSDQRDGSINDHPDLDDFRRQVRDLYIASGDVSFWQGAIRDRSDPSYDDVLEILNGGGRLSLHLLYSDHEGGQRAISRFSVVNTQASSWFVTVVRHWNIDRADPR